MRILTMIVLSILSIAANASSWEGKVIAIEVTVTSPVVLFRLSGKLDGSPRCNEKGMYAIDTTHPGGKAAFNLLRSAYEQGRNVSAQGLNTCSVHFDADGLKRITFE